jgi:hypothetical protein
MEAQDFFLSTVTNLYCSENVPTIFHEILSGGSLFHSDSQTNGQIWRG